MGELDRALSRLVKAAGLVLMLGTIACAIGVAAVLAWYYEAI